MVDAYAHRLQIQEKMNAQIANSIPQVLEPEGVAVVLGGDPPMHDHARRSQIGRDMVTAHARRLPGGRRTRREFLNMIGNPASR